MTALTGPATVQDRYNALRARHALILAMCRAAVAAEAAGSPDPLAWLRRTLASHGQAPAPGARASQVAADAATAMQLTSRHVPGLTRPDCQDCVSGYLHDHTAAGQVTS